MIGIFYNKYWECYGIFLFLSILLNGLFIGFISGFIEVMKNKRGGFN